MTSTEATACERKPTRPSIIIPQLRPVSNEADATGSRRLPEATATKTPSQQSVGDVIELNIVKELESAPGKKRNILKELGLELSDDEAMPAVKNKTILIEPMRGPGLCTYKLVKGGKKGQECGKKSVKGQTFCAAHSTKHRFDKPSRTIEADGVKNKLESLEKVVLNLMKNSRAPASKATTSTSINSLDSVCASLEKIRNQIGKIEQSAELVLDKKNQKKSRNIQKIRIYKLNPFETYLLIRYKDGNPIFQIKSSGRYIQVPLPNRMARPIPNGKWSLVCHPEQPLMIWKEV